MLPGHVVRYCSGCVNPWHARLQRAEEFTQEIRLPAPLRGEATPQAKLDAKTVRRVVRLWNSGWTGRQIRGRIGPRVTVHAIQAITTGRTWQCLDLAITRQPRRGRWRTGHQVLTDVEVMIARHLHACGYGVRESWRRCGTRAGEGATTQAISGRTFRHLPLPVYPREALALPGSAALVRVRRAADVFVDPEEYARAQLLDISGIPGSVIDDVAGSMIEQERERRGR